MFFLLDLNSESAAVAAVQQQQPPQSVTAVTMCDFVTPIINNITLEEMPNKIIICSDDMIVPPRLQQQPQQQQHEKPIDKIIRTRAPVPAGSTRLNFYKKIASGTKVIWPLHDKKTFIFIERDDNEGALKYTRSIYPFANIEDVQIILNRLIVVPSDDRVEIKKICCICYHKPTKGHIVQHSNNHWKSKVKITIDAGCWSSFDSKRNLYQLNNKSIFESLYLRQYEGIMKIWTDHFASKTNIQLVFADLLRFVNLAHSS